MRVCLIHLSGKVTWLNADTDEVMEPILKYDEAGAVQTFTFIEEVNTKNHVYWRYQELVTEITQ